MNAPGRTCPKCDGGIATVVGQRPPHFCTSCGERYERLPECPSPLRERVAAGRDTREGSRILANRVRR